MPTYTPNYNLKKPAGDEFYNIADHNSNMDAIDTALKSVEESTDTSLTDDTTGTKYKWGIDNGIAYLEEVE